MVRAKNIKLEIVWDGEIYIIETFAHEYRNLMTLLYDRLYIDGFGECKGIGRCGTCHIRVPGAHGLGACEGNENTTLAKMEATSTHSRLACQIMVDERLNGLRIEVMGDDDVRF